jgi:hypothetical protein
MNFATTPKAAAARSVPMLTMNSATTPKAAARSVPMSAEEKKLLFQKQRAARLRKAAERLAGASSLPTAVGELQERETTSVLTRCADLIDCTDHYLTYASVKQALIAEFGTTPLTQTLIKP